MRLEQLSALPLRGGATPPPAPILPPLTKCCRVGVRPDLRTPRGAASGFLTVRGPSPAVMSASAPCTVLTLLCQKYNKTVIYSK